MDLDGQPAWQGSDGVGARPAMDLWLEALPGDGCGDDLEYDAVFHELNVAAAGKTETQFAAAQPPEWRVVQEKAAELFERTRDLRVAVLWARAQLHLEGFVSLADSLYLIRGLLERFWDHLHPVLDADDGEAYARVSTLASLADMGGLLGDLRQAVVVKHRAIGELRVRDIEIALDRLPPRDDESPRTRGQITGLLSDFGDVSEGLRQQCKDVAGELTALYNLMTDRFGFDQAIDVRPLRNMADGVFQILPPPPAVDDDEEAAADETPAWDATDTEEKAPVRRGKAQAGLSGEIDSREEAVRAIDMICAYLERHEPSNPAQQMLRRAQRLINKNFLQLVQELAPDALNEVARLMGIDPNSVSSDD